MAWWDDLIESEETPGREDEDDPYYKFADLQDGGRGELDPEAVVA